MGAKINTNLARQHFNAIERDRFGREPEPDEADVEYAERRAAARALRAIPSEARSEQSRAYVLAVEALDATRGER